ncbi:MAG TPA: chorismate mutase [Ktedonobacterales bacterium]|nr:chorismate mutase [Ktedonobacterales bacterium]
MEVSSTTRCRGLRGATTAVGNSAAAILAATRELLERLVARNALDAADIASAFFTVTDDLDAAYPALAARELGWNEVALLCAREIPVPGSVARCIRVLLHINTTMGQGDLRHIYLREAVALRPDVADIPPQATMPAVERVAILGLGLMGASLGMALRERGAARMVVGFDADPGVTERALERGAIDIACASVAEAVASSNLVALATPLLAMRELLAEIAPLLAETTIVTDLGSTKAEVISWADSLLSAPGKFVGGHPMAGSEQSGVEAANSSLFDGCVWCLTPTDYTATTALHRVAQVIESVGAHPRIMPPEQHDQAVALASHLPLVAASALTLTTTQAPEATEALALAAGGFRDTTRVASGSPRMARDICLANTTPLLAALDRYVATLQSFRDQIAERNPTLEDTFAAAKEARDRWLAGQS